MTGHELLVVYGRNHGASFSVRRPVSHRVGRLPRRSSGRAWLGGDLERWDATLVLEPGDQAAEERLTSVGWTRVSTDDSGIVLRAPG